LLNFEYNSSSDSQTAYVYDAYGRAATKTVTIDGLDFINEVTYDQYGRLFQNFDASGGNRGLAYSYKNGAVEKVYETRGSSTGQSTEYFKVLSVDAIGNIKSSIQGNGVNTSKNYDQSSGFLKSISTNGSVSVQNSDFEFDGLGNLRSRRDQNQLLNGQTLNEVFEYDVLNRMTSTKLNGLETLSLTYDLNGNILAKSDVAGTYNYGNPAANCVNNFAGPHAVTAVGSKNYCYDVRGNQTHAYSSGSNTRTIDYGYIDKPISISSQTGTTYFDYDTNNNRIKRTDTKSGSSQAQQILPTI